MGLYTATDSHPIHFHQLQRGTSDRIRNRRVNERTGDEVELDDIVKAYDTGDEYVLVEPKELDEIAPGRSRSLDIAGFVDLTGEAAGRPQVAQGATQLDGGTGNPVPSSAAALPGPDPTDSTDGLKRAFAGTAALGMLLLLIGCSCTPVARCREPARQPEWGGASASESSCS